MKVRGGSWAGEDDGRPGGEEEGGATVVEEMEEEEDQQDGVIGIEMENCWEWQG